MSVSHDFFFMFLNVFKSVFYLKNIKLIFCLIVYDVLMSKIKKIKIFILMHFQAKSYFKKYHIPQF
jgi:hypothetical protein